MVNSNLDRVKILALVAWEQGWHCRLFYFSFSLFGLVPHCHGHCCRFQRLAMIVRDGKVEYVGVDSKGLDQSSAAAILKNL